MTREPLDIFDRLADLAAEGTSDLIVTSPPYFALRSYLPQTENES